MRYCCNSRAHRSPICGEETVPLERSRNKGCVHTGALWLRIHELQELPEGRILTRLLIARERNRKLVAAAKRNHVLRTCGKLVCEGCGFDFEQVYGGHGSGFIECHDTRPVFTLAAGTKTHIADLALLCTNCHRMVHRRREWLTPDRLKALLQTVGPNSRKSAVVTFTARLDSHRVSSLCAVVLPPGQRGRVAGKRGGCAVL